MMFRLLRLPAALLLALMLAPDRGTALQVGGQSRFDVNADYDCCNIASGQIIGRMTIQRCAMRPGHSPLIPGNPNNERMCKAPPAPSGGAPRYEDKPVWTVYRPNIPNGSFERWSGAKPVGFGTYSKPTNRTVPGLNEFETAFRASDAIEGSAALQLKNFKPNVDEWVRGRPIPPFARAIMERVVFSAGVVTCEPNCPITSGSGTPGNIEATAFPVRSNGTALCGAFKSNLRGSDKLSISLLLRKAGEAIGGATAFDIMTARLSREPNGWTKFLIPIAKLPGKASATPDSGILQVQVLPGGFSPQAPAGAGEPAQGSEALVDAVHLCGGIDLQIADAKSSGGAPVPEEHEEVGAIAFINYDNDDGDRSWDYMDDDGVTPGDDDLAELTLQLPPGARGTVELRKLGGPNVRIWTSPYKQPGEVFGDLGAAKTLPAGFDENGKRSLWVEGISPSAATSDVVFELIYTPEGTNAASAERDKVALTVLAVKDLVWKGKGGNSEFDDDKLTADPNHPRVQAAAAGSDPYDNPLRVFPGKRYVSNAATDARRDKVDLEVTLNVKPPRKTTLWLKAFDVDDPSAKDDAVDDDSAPDDNRGATIAGSGIFTRSASGELELEFEEAAATAEFQVTMQPGDNFRVAAAWKKENLAQLANDDTLLKADWADGARIVDKRMLQVRVPAADAEVPEPGAWLSDTLTVWRFLHVERDSMAPIEGNVLHGVIRSITPGAPRGKSATWIFETDLNIVANRPPSADASKGHYDSFINGQLRIGGAPFYIAGNTARGSGGDAFTIVDSQLADEKLRNALVNKRFDAIDDDHKAINIAGSPGAAGPFEDGWVIPLPPDDRLRISSDNPYLKAYVYPRIDTLTPAPGSRRFIGNLRTDREIEYIRAFFGGFTQVAHEDDPDLWTVYLLGAFQGVKWEDGDGLLEAGGRPAGGVAGEADGPGGEGALIYWSSGAELEAEHQSAPGWRLIDAVVHELGHLFGADHADKGLMSDGLGDHGEPSEFFSDKSLAKIRSATHP